MSKMHPADAILKALTPGDLFNQTGLIWRSAFSLAQFAGIPQCEVPGVLEVNLADRVTIRPGTKNPEKGIMVALTEHIPAPDENVEQVKIIGGNAVEGEAVPADVDDLVEDEQEVGAVAGELAVEEQVEHAVDDALIVKDFFGDLAKANW